MNKLNLKQLRQYFKELSTCLNSGSVLRGARMFYSFSDNAKLFNVTDVNYFIGYDRVKSKKSADSLYARSLKC